jgi:hypothetical protein
MRHPELFPFGKKKTPSPVSLIPLPMVRKSDFFSSP